MSAGLVARGGILVAVLWGAGACSGGASTCELDSDCGGGEVCARTRECLAPGQVREVQVRWTVRGAAPSAATCAPVEPVGIQFSSTKEDELKYSPVACAAGLFTIDKLPIRMTTVQLTGTRVFGIANIPSDGQVVIDLR